jgi:large subunit ribosomal protein L23
MSIFSRLKSKGPATPSKAKETVKAEAKDTTIKVAPKKSTAQPAAKAVVGISEVTTQTLLAPLVTEKSAHLTDQGVYVFKVPLSATRITVGKAFKELYKVTPAKVNIVRVHGKPHRFGRQISQRSDWKKALISLPKGQRVDIFEKL